MMMLARRLRRHSGDGPETGTRVNECYYCYHRYYYYYIITIIITISIRALKLPSAMVTTCNAVVTVCWSHEILSLLRWFDSEFIANSLWTHFSYRFATPGTPRLSVKINVTW